MPTSHGVKVQLKSQYDIQTIPEYAPPLSKKENSIRLLDSERRLISVYIPRLECSQFWICYSATPSDGLTKFVYFKLSIDRAHVVSWGCGEGDGYEGKTMFGLFGTGKRDAQKRALFFSQLEHDSEREDWESMKPDGVLELRIYRSSSRKRIPPDLVEFRDTHIGRNGGNGVELVNAGQADKECPKRFYKYALIDAIDQPFVTFRFYPKTWDQLQDLGVDFECGGSEKVRLSGAESRLELQECGTEPHDPSLKAHDSSHHISADAAGFQVASSTFEDSSWKDSSLEDDIHARRLSVPPSTAVLPRPGLATPGPNEGSMAEAVSPADTDNLSEGCSPVNADMPQPDHVPSEKVRRRANSAAVLREVVARALRRQER